MVLAPWPSVTTLALILGLVGSVRSFTHDAQHPLRPDLPAINDHPSYPPRVDYAALYHDDGTTPPPDRMVLHPLHISGPEQERVSLTFFADGYVAEEEGKFVADAQALTDDIVSPGGAMGHVSRLLNIYAVFVPSNTSGVGTYDKSLPGAAFGLYRPGPELRGVYVRHHKRARAACRYWREEVKEGGCDQPILLGNDPLYGGLGGEFTVITASALNGPLVLRHELGHSLIPVGEEYEGGFAYFGANSDKVAHVGDLKWKSFLTLPEDVRVEDAKVPSQEYPWYNLTEGPYNITFQSSNSALKPVVSHGSNESPYPTALLRLSLSSIPQPGHINLTLNSRHIDLSAAFPKSWVGSKDRRWVEVPLENGLPAGENVVDVRLTQEGAEEQEGEGGKMITSLEIMEYGREGRFNESLGFIGAFPTYSMDGRVTLRPTNEECLMRKVNHPTFCPVCAAALEQSLLGKIERKNKNQGAKQEP
ncbi:hypothetical protein EHS25_002393 [Saitozyma podzolica]|uniref:Uncharacterized protein n=1 Tax=Saitozyma podzolica TaxID=1890683 RepID=A0A427YDN9_9TREE|nr:hypothetical protein EHS25_002393 [Saitozyma podzolica]